MDYKLYTDYITLQALLKECGIIQSGGAAKAFLANTEIFFNGELENRRGKKLRLGDEIRFGDQIIKLVPPSKKEMKQYFEDKAEKERVAKLVKSLNKEHQKTRQTTQKTTVGVYRKANINSKTKQPVRFPGT